ncbi:MAG TPA: sigma-70 family RNA polymerase sigma factor [Gemmataceae bacterium]|nr:sigma-70 family RNA polymerase sigma factor [Gemmataceae bacterium]
MLAARNQAAPQAREALAVLCRTYWYPLYAYIRHRGYDVHHAQDLTQDFFTRLLEKDSLATVDRDKGKFRSFLLAACKHFLANAYDRAQAQKRGGGKILGSLDFNAGEGRYSREPAHDLTPEKLFERRWAMTLLHQVLDDLRAEYEQAGKGSVFDRLKSVLSGDSDVAPYSQLAGELNTSEAAVKMTVHRLRRRYRERLRQEIAQTVGNPAHVEQEIRDLFAALRP